MPERGEIWLANLNPRRLTLSLVRSQNLQSPPLPSCSSAPGLERVDV